MLIAGLATALIWALVSGKDGFKGNNAIIVARSISILATLDGQVVNDPPAVGDRVRVDELLVRIHNSRIDRGRLVELDSEIAYLQRSIENAEAQQEELSALLAHYEEKLESHSKWLLADTELRVAEAAAQTTIAQATARLRQADAARTEKLHKENHVSEVVAESAATVATIAATEVSLYQTQRKRSQLLHNALKAESVFFDNGDASYWEKMADSLTFRQIDNLNAIATLSAQLDRARSRVQVERSRIGTTVEEEHRASFDGLVNASYVTEGTRVTRGASLLQVLDCASPIILVPLPEHRISEFGKGMAVSIYPIDTNDEFSGSIDYISSGPLIGRDQTLQVQEEMTVSGVHAVVSFDDNSTYADPSQPCETAHRAVVVIHTKSMVRLAANWIRNIF